MKETARVCGDGGPVRHRPGGGGIFPGRTTTNQSDESLEAPRMVLFSACLFCASSALCAPFHKGFASAWARPADIGGLQPRGGGRCQRRRGVTSNIPNRVFPACLIMIWRPPPLWGLRGLLKRVLCARMRGKVHGGLVEERGFCQHVQEEVPIELNYKSSVLIYPEKPTHM